MPRNFRGSKEDDLLSDGGTSSSLSGGRGDDVYRVDNAGTLISETRNGGLDVVEASVSYALGDWIEQLHLVGEDDIDGFGNDLDNVLTGNSGDNSLFGGAGNDTISGGAGRNEIWGGDGDDIAEFEGSISNFVISATSEGLTVSSIDGTQVTKLSEVEWLAFDDDLVRVADLYDTGVETVLSADEATLDEDGVVYLDVLANDQGDGLRLVSVSGATLGTVAITADGLVEYRPDENVNGDDAFEYTVQDADGVLHTSSATISILPVNDDPTAVDDVADVTDTAGVFQSGFSVLDNDADSDGETLNIAGFDATTANGGAIQMNADGTFSYTAPSALDPAQTNVDADSFTYTVQDEAGAQSTATVFLNLPGTQNEPPAEPTSSGAPDYAIEALIPGDADTTTFRWNGEDPLGTPVTITYSFLTGVPDYYSAAAPEREGFAEMSDAQKSVVLEAFGQIESFTNITFVEATDGIGDIAFGTADLPSGSGWAYGPSTSLLGGDVWIDNVVSLNNDLDPGGDGFKTILHEIGHALGLEHPHEGDLLPDDEMSRSYTLMSYASPSGSGGIEPSSYMQYDIAALQHLYGVDTQSTAGDDLYDVSNAQDLVMTIWDAGGFDTLSAAGSVDDVVLNLNEGSFSSSGEAYGFYGMTNNISLAYGTWIEAAAGGLGNDVLIGSSGDNWLTGGEGSDSFVMDRDWGNDVITDFTDGEDRIDLSGTGARFEDLLISDVDGNVVVAFGDDNLTLNGVQADALNEQDFLFGGLV